MCGLLVFKSITYAQSASYCLGRCGILSTLIRVPASLGSGSCSYGLKVDEKDMRRAYEAVCRRGLPVAGVYIEKLGEYRRVDSY